MSAATVDASELLAAIEDLLHANAAATHSNQGGTWFIDPAGMGTGRLDPTGIIELRERVYAKLKAADTAWMMPHRSYEDFRVRFEPTPEEDAMGDHVDA